MADGQTGREVGEKQRRLRTGLAGLLYNCMRNIIITYYNGQGKKRRRKVVEKYPETDHEQNTVL